MRPRSPVIPAAVAAPLVTEYAWARRLGIHVNRPPKGVRRDGTRPPASRVRIVTIDGRPPVRIESARAVAAACGAGMLVLCELPARFVTSPMKER